MLRRCVRVKLLVPARGGLSFRPFAPDTTDRSRFPPHIRLQATLFGAPLGSLDMSAEDGTGRIHDLSASSWARPLAAERLLAEAESVARGAAWHRLVWEIPTDADLRALAQRAGFGVTSDTLLEKSIAAPRP